jgi:GNAT superfamily N-acetyltransferase
LVTAKPKWSAEQVEAICIPLVNKYYKANRARGKAKGDDCVWVIKNNYDIIAALRVVALCGHSFLTSVQVDEQFQGQGVGRALISQVFEHLYDPSDSNNNKRKPCYTFPYRHLIGFYASMGWVELAEEDLPLPLLTRFKRYQRQGRDIGVMGIQK